MGMPDTADTLNQGISASCKGAAKMLADMKLCFDIVNPDMPLDQYKLLILPDKLEITPALKETLNAFPGSILSCGESLDTQGRWDFITHTQPDTNRDGFYPLGDRKVAMYALSIKMKSSHSRVDYIEPRFDRVFDGKHSYFYIPPGDAKGYCAIAKKGNTTHVCFDIFRAYFENDAEYLRDTLWPLVEELLPQSLLTGRTLPVLFRATLMQGKTRILQIKTTYPSLWNQTGKIPEHLTVAEGLRLGVLGSYKQVRTIPDRKTLKSEIRDGRTWITLDKIQGYAAIELT